MLSETIDVFHGWRAPFSRTALFKVLAIKCDRCGDYFLPWTSVLRGVSDKQPQDEITRCAKCLLGGGDQ